MRTLSTLLLLVIIGSCTIQRRLHRPGFHVEWRGRFQQATSNMTPDGTGGAIDLDALDSEKRRPEIAETIKDTALMKSIPVLATPTESKDVQRIGRTDSTRMSVFISAIPTDTTLVPSKDQPRYVNKKHKRQPVHPLALISFISSFYPPTLVIVWLFVSSEFLLVLAPAIALAVMILSSISLSLIYREPGQYRGKAFAWLGLLFALGFLHLAAIVLLLAF